MDQTHPQNEGLFRQLDFPAIMARYGKLRQIGVSLNSLLVRRLSQEMLFEGADKLGLLDKGKIVLGDESQMCVLMDYCLFNVHREGRNAVEQYLDEAPKMSDPVEIDYWNAMRSATFSLIAVEGIEPRVGCYVRDMATDTQRLLVDVGLSQSGSIDFVMATRILDYGDFITTGGAGLPVGNAKDPVERDLLMQLKERMSAENFDPAIFISTALDLGSSSLIRYDNASTNARGIHRSKQRRPRETVSAQRKQLVNKIASLPSPNVRCRCGSGKMFKNCCGK